MEIVPIAAYYTDDWQSDSKYIPHKQHDVGKKDTWKIERRHVNFRTHLKRFHRKTICFSKNEDIHDHVIGLYIKHHYYKNLAYTKAA